MRLRLFLFSLRDQASNWLERLLAGSISTWEDLTTCFLAQFFQLGRSSKLKNDILVFQQHQGKKEKVKSIALKAKKESSDDETSTSGRNQEKKRSHSDNMMRRKERMIENALGVVIQIISLAIIQNHLATKIKRPSLEVLRAIAKMTPKTKLTMKLVSWLNRQMSLKIINKNKILKTKRDLLEKEILELNEKIKKLEKRKEIDITYKLCQELKLENARLKETQVKFVKFDKIINSLREMLNNQKPSCCKIGLGFDSSKASTSGSKPISFVGLSVENTSEGSTIKVHGSTIPGSVNRIGAEK
nr:zinc finger, CCHC-type [Tanacetum cinerariifolium]